MLENLKLLAKRPERFPSRCRVIKAMDEQIASARLMAILSRWKRENVSPTLRP